MFVIYGKEDCKYCRMSKKALDLVNEDYTYIPLEGADLLRQELRDQGFETIPAIFLHGEKLGGYSELHSWITDKYLS